MFKLFKSRKKKELDAERIYKIYESVDVSERINSIVNSEYNRMIYYAEKAALYGETSFVYKLKIHKKDQIYFNMIISNFINKIVDNGFTYSRQMLNDKSRFTIYFSRIIPNK